HLRNDMRQLWSAEACLRFHCGMRRLASALIRRQLAVAGDTLNGKTPVSCGKEIAIASYRKGKAAASRRTPQ
ncbi:MAG: hypothetical protein ACUVTH_15380, partial [Thermogutta sp.]